MRRIAMALGLAAAVMFAVGVSAQGKNFAGKWTVDQEKTTAANPVATAGGGGGGGRGGGRGGGGRGGGNGDLNITMDDKTITIESGTATNPTKAVYNLDGSDSKNTMPGRNGAEGTEQVSNAKWDGDKLVITTKTANGENTTSYWLDGANLTSSRMFGQTERKTVYKKAS